MDTFPPNILPAIFQFSLENSRTHLVLISTAQIDMATNITEPTRRIKLQLSSQLEVRSSNDRRSRCSRDDCSRSAIDEIASPADRRTAKGIRHLVEGKSGERGNGIGVLGGGMQLFTVDQSWWE